MPTIGEQRLREVLNPDGGSLTYRIVALHPGDSMWKPPGRKNDDTIVNHMAQTMLFRLAAGFGSWVGPVRIESHAVAMDDAVVLCRCGDGVHKAEKPPGRKRADAAEVPEYFGERWPSGICDEGVQVRTPVGEHCTWCQAPVMEGDRGSIMWVAGSEEIRAAPIHRECQLVSAVGSREHWEGRCACRTGDWSKRPKTPEEVRQGALDMWAWMEEKTGERHAAGVSGSDGVVGSPGKGAGLDIRGVVSDGVPGVEEGGKARPEDQG